jgi:hypothetical protein
LVVATGGLSIPQIGATGFGYALAGQFGLKRVALRPGLVPLTFAQPEKDLFAALSGVAIEATVTCGKHSFTENVLFTHRGLSGPAILQISSAWREGESIFVDLFPRVSMQEALSGRTVSPGNWPRWRPRTGASSRRCAARSIPPMNRYTSARGRNRSLLARLNSGSWYGGDLAGSHAH